MSLSQPSDGIEQCHVEWTDLERVLQKSLHTNATFGANKKSTNVGLGVGFNSRICLIEPDWIGSKDGDNLSDRFILKISSQLAMKEYSDLQAQIKGEEAAFKITDVELKMMEPAVKMLHNVECFMYDKITAANNGLIIPRIFGKQSFSPENQLKGFIAMEQMTDLENVMIHQNVTAKEMEQPLRNLAKLQAIGETFNDEERKHVHNNVFTNYYQYIFSVPMVTALSQAISKGGRDHLKAKADKMISLIPEYCSPEGYAKHDKLHKTLDRDFPMCNFGCVAFDLARVFSAGMDPKERQQNTVELLETYHRILTEELKGQNIPYTVDQLKTSYELAFPLAVMMILPTLIPLVDGMGADVPKEIVDRVVGKVEALLDDLLYYHEKNSKRAAKIPVTIEKKHSVDRDEEYIEASIVH